MEVTEGGETKGGEENKKEEGEKVETEEKKEAGEWDQVKVRFKVVFYRSQIFKSN